MLHNILYIWQGSIFTMGASGEEVAKSLFGQNGSLDFRHDRDLGGIPSPK